MIDKRTPFFAIRRNNDGTYSILDTREGIRLIKAGLRSHDEAKQWCDHWHLQHGTMKHGGVKY
jgi:hypothetical protein